MYGYRKDEKGRRKKGKDFAVYSAGQTYSEDTSVENLWVKVKGQSNTGDFMMGVCQQSRKMRWRKPSSDS